MAQQGTRRILVELLGDESSLQRSFQKGGKEAEKFGLTLTAVTRSTGGFSRGFLSGAGALSSFGGALALTSGSFFAGAGLVAGLKASVGAAANFQQTMNVLKQVTAGTSSELSAASREARQLGADITLPATSATDAAQAMLQLAKGGLTLKQSMAAARGTLQLAAAAQTDVATAADTTARALTAFGLSGDNAGSIADALANAAQSATGDIGDFALGLSQSATSAHQFGLTAQDTVTALTELAKAGIVGSDAGTSLRVMLTRLLPTSKAAKREMAALGISVHDANGNFLPFRDIIQQYSKALGRLTPVQRQHGLQVIFGTDAQRAANIILNQSVGTYDRLNAVVSKSGGAARAAAAQQKGFKGVLDGFNSALQTTEVTIGTALLPTLTTYLRSLSKWLSDSRNQAKIQKETEHAVADFGKVLTVTGHAISDITDALKGFSDAVGGARNAVGLFAGAFVAFKFRSVLSNLGLLGSGFKNVGTQAEGATKKVDGLTGAQKRLAAVRQLPTPGSSIGGGQNPFVFGSTGNPFSSNPASQIPNRDLRNQGFFDRIFGGAFAAKTLAKTGELGGGGLILPGISPDSHPGISLLPGRIITQGRNKFIVVAVDGKIAIIPLQDFKNLPVGNLPRATQDSLNPRIGTPGSGVGTLPSPVGGGGGIGDVGSKSKPLTVQQRNTFFDNDIARILQRGGLGTINQQIGALKEAASRIAQRIAVTKDVTRKLNLEDQLLSISSQEKGLRQQQMQEFIDSLQFNVDKAAVTGTLKDDLSTLQALQHGIEQQIKTQGKTLALQQSLFDVNQKIAATRQQQRDRRQFALIGLGPTGGELIPVVSTLKREAQRVSDEIAGTTLGTKKNTTLIAHIRQLLNLKGLSAEVRTGIKNLLDGIDQEFKKHGAQTRVRHASTEALLSGLGLSADQIRVLRQRVSQISATGTVPGKTSPAFAGAGAVNQTDIFLDGKKIASNTTDHQVKAGKRRTSSRRG
jgi:TP901 family phage tail tape measure protein